MNFVYFFHKKLEHSENYFNQLIISIFVVLNVHINYTCIWNIKSTEIAISLFFFLGTGDSGGGTESPIRRWTGLHYTEPGDDGVDLIGLSESGRSNGEIWRDQMGTGFGSSGMKSTRHLPPQPKYHDNFHKNFYSHRSPTSATIQVWSNEKNYIFLSIDVFHLILS